MTAYGREIGLEKKLKAYIKEARDAGGAGVSAAVMIDGELIASITEGIRGHDQTPVDESDLYNIGSVSKVYCAAAVMKLVEMNKLSLEDKVCDYLPKFEMADERYKEITIRMTLNHTSGLPGTNLKGSFATEWNGKDYIDQNYRYLSEAKLKHNPGEVSIYCNDGFTLAALIVEAVSGKTYIDFLREVITDPIGATSTGIGNTALDQGTLMSVIGAKKEILMPIGAGCIHTTISDCVRFGNIFINDHGPLTSGSINEICSKQGAFLMDEDHQSGDFGLGWDLVAFKSPFNDLGENALFKSGGTPQFSSLLIVSPKYNLSAAISATADCKINVIRALCEMIAIALEDLNMAKPIEKKPPRVVNKQPIPEELAKKYQGLYYGSSGTYITEFKEDQLIMTPKKNAKSQSDENNKSYDYNGVDFVSKDGRVTFVDYEHRQYLFMNKELGYRPFAEKPNQVFDVSKGWKDRIGKRYIGNNFSPSDGFMPLMHSFTLEKNNDGVLNFATTMGEIPIIASSKGNNETDHVLSGFNGASRDTFTPFAYMTNNMECIRIGNIEYVNLDDVQELKTGRVVADSKEKNVIYKTRQGMSIYFEKPEGVEVLFLDDGLNIIHTGVMDSDHYNPADGYICFVNDVAMDFSITVK